MTRLMWDTREEVAIRGGMHTQCWLEFRIAASSHYDQPTAMSS
jgi:hypothetical protein